MIAAADQIPTALAPFVVTLNEYDLGSNPIGVHRGLPSSTVSITIPERDLMEISPVRRPDPPRRLRAVVAGLHLSPVVLRQAGCTRGVWLTLSPMGASALFGFPASTLAGHIVELADAVPALANLPERLAACRSWPERRTLVERCLLTGLARNGERSNHDELRATLAVLSDTTRVQDAAQLLGYSRRHLSSTVRAAFGVTPKEYQRLIRFEAARGRLVAAARTGNGGLAAVAAASGFADQAHFTREWRALAGCTPTDWLRAEGLANRSQMFKTSSPSGTTMNV
jgi:AraC-like DNA-binding protein